MSNDRNTDMREWFDSIDVEQADDVKLDFAVALQRALSHSQITRSDLARILKTSPAWVTKVLRGDANLTIDTMCELSKALNHEVHVHLAPINAEVKWFEAYTRHAVEVETTVINSWEKEEGLRDEWRISARA